MGWKETVDISWVGWDVALHCSLWVRGGGVKSQTKMTMGSRAESYWDIWDEVEN